ncbi:branched-chain amino acid ABC transporter permease [Nitratireductor mangrovi]|uniref:Branched-chain amino acid ABC transporter permease n=1 Tax=Nitratireductor mangrovi TaxID=2599600 RepID=A0A5B8L5W7_9HYPH|nr:branched-chain amino acid ABC transporter permease [Nitratireductor mangrovi]QDZ03100.1 branched-chain amino acid ABC transporter permease [Nitratireductor mangrovi]
MDVLQLFVSGLANGCVYGLIALGFVLIYKATEAVNFAQGDFMMLGAFITLGLTNEQFWGLPFWVSVPIAVVMMGIFGYLLDMIVLRRMFGQSQVAVVILTIALGFVLRFAAGLIWGHQPIALESPMAGKEVRFGGLVLGLDEVTIIFVTVILTVVLYFYFNRTKLGVAMQAASQNQLAAYYMGIPVKRVHSLIWALAGAVAAIAGVLFASKGSIDPSIGLLGIKAFAAAVIGGFGSLPGALLGGVIVGLIEPFASYYIAAGYSQIMPYLLLFLILVFRPHGILAQVHRKKV